MHRHTKLAALSALLFATAWGKPQGTFDYGVNANTPAGQTAIIRTALKSEKRFHLSKARRIFGGGDSLPEFIVISKGYDVPGAANVKNYAAVRVQPGKYLARLMCTGMFMRSFDLEVDAQAGGEYLLECTGDGNAMQAHVWRKEMSAADAAAATSVGAPSDATQKPASASTWVAPWSW